MGLEVKKGRKSLLFNSKKKISIENLDWLKKQPTKRKFTIDINHQAIVQTLYRSLLLTGKVVERSNLKILPVWAYFEISFSVG